MRNVVTELVWIAQRTLLAVVLAGCGSTWQAVDEDGDGFSILEGDCDDSPNGRGIGPGAEEVWYNGVDENCDGNDADQDLDGFLSVDAGGDDCWDDPDGVPGEFAAMNGFAQPAADEVNPAATIDEWYDGVDSDCDGTDDFDQDGDGFASTAWAEARTPLPVTDCYDAATEVYPELWPTCIPEIEQVITVPMAPQDVHPGATDTWYDGTDADCGGDDDFDQDGDAYAACDECNDLDELVKPNDAEEIWYNHLDENCDGNDADQDFDGFVASDYVEADLANPIHEFLGTGDCYDDPTPANRPPDMAAINGFPSLDAGEVNPGATETWYDAVDADCGGEDDFDQDGDAHTTDAYADRVGFYGDDCDDLDGGVYGGAFETFYDGVDADCNGLSDYDQDQDGHDSEGFGVPGADDCDDSKASVNPEQIEECTTVDDENCDGNLNDDDAYDCSDFWADDDRDTFGDVNDSRCLCEAEDTYDVVGVTVANDDCDDTRALVNPDASNEECGTEYDDDCDGVVNEQNGDDCTTYYLDADSDSFGTTASQCWCAESGDYKVENTDDCDDTRAIVNPDAANEDCETAYDDDCDTVTNERNGDNCVTYNLDTDGDSYGTSTTQCWCTATGDYDVFNADDCDGNDANTFPGAAPSDGAGCMTDADGDNFGDVSPASGVVAGTDCDDSKAAVKPDVAELCSTTDDDDCSGSVNDVGATGCITYYYDGDNDAFGNAALPQCTCTTTGAYDVTVNTDCDDNDLDTFPGAASADSATACMNDDDGDNYGDVTVISGVTAGTDCDDAIAAVKPGAGETCATAYDDDCDASTNDPGATGCAVYYRDQDVDTYGNSASTTCRCTLPSGYVANSTDCDDTRSGVNTAATETCGTTYDDDCDGSDNDLNATSCTTYYYDGDGDGYGLLSSTQCMCTASGDYDVTGVTTSNDDCNDTLSAVKPGTAELCSTAYDDDCDSDSSTNDVGATGCTTYYYDGDNDGYGLLATSQCTCIASGSYDVTSVTTSNDDCDDTLSAVSPVGTETCGTAYDDDCDGSSNDIGATSCVTYYYDGDGDGAGLLSSSQCTCSASGDFDVTSVTTSNDDCDDTKSNVNPSGTETCATADDEDCDGSTNDLNATSCTNYYYDGDGDGAGILTGPQCMCTASGDYDVTGVTSSNDDCDDTKSYVKPGVAETCATSDDEDCDGSNNDVGAVSCVTYYYDGDGDGAGLISSSQCTCVASGDYDITSVTTSNDDCDDTKSNVNPSGTETCATADDENCDGSTNDLNATSCTTYYYDGDGDGAGLISSTQCTCTASGDFDVTSVTASNDDCDDTKSYVKPGATETCVTTDDEDCDGSNNDIDATSCTTYYADVDNDGAGLISSSQCTCSASGNFDITGVNAANDDCDDGDIAVNPSATETCSTAYDDDCDGSTNELGATGCVVYYYDGDDDGAGLLSTNQCACTAAGFYDVTGVTSANDDCDDTVATTKPGASDVLVTGDQVDNDCDDLIDESGVLYGDIVVTEFNVGESTFSKDWFELYNTSDYVIALDDWTISLCHEAATDMAAPPFLGDTACDSEVILDVNSDIATPMTIAPGEYLVLCYAQGTFTDLTDCTDTWITYDSPAYASTTDLEPDLGGIIVEMGTDAIDDVTWWQSTGATDDWPTSANSSIQLDIAAVTSTGDLAADLNDDYGTALNTYDIWCASAGLTGVLTFTPGREGTPGSANLDCTP